MGTLTHRAGNWLTGVAGPREIDSWEYQTPGSPILANICLLPGVCYLKYFNPLIRIWVKVMKKKLVVINLVGLSRLRKLRLQLGFSVQYLANKNVQKRWLRKICWTRKKNLHMMMQLQNWQRVLSNFAPIFLNWSCLALAIKRPAHLAGIRKLVYTQHTHLHINMNYIYI